MSMDTEDICRRLDGIREALLLLVSISAGASGDRRVSIPGYVSVEESWRQFSNTGHRIRLKDWCRKVSDVTVTVAGVPMIPAVTAAEMVSRTCAEMDNEN